MENFITMGKFNTYKHKHTHTQKQSVEALL